MSAKKSKVKKAPAAAPVLFGDVRHEIEKALGVTMLLSENSDGHNENAADLANDALCRRGFANTPRRVSGRSSSSREAEPKPGRRFAPIGPSCGSQGGRLS